MMKPIAAFRNCFAEVIANLSVRTNLTLTLVNVILAVLERLHANRQTDRQTHVVKPIGAFLQFIIMSVPKW